MTLREARSNDAQVLSVLARQTYSAAFGHSFEPADLESHLNANLSVEKFEHYLSGDIILLAEDEDTLVGYVQFGATELLKEQELRRLYVRADFQGQGVGSRLMEAALEHPQMKQAEQIVLDVWEHNPRARRFYEGYGFEVVGKRAFEVKSGAETSLDLVMIRRQIA